MMIIGNIFRCKGAIEGNNELVVLYIQTGPDLKNIRVSFSFIFKNEFSPSYKMYFLYHTR